MTWALNHSQALYPSIDPHCSLTWTIMFIYPPFSVVSLVTFSVILSLSAKQCKRIYAICLIVWAFTLQFNKTVDLQSLKCYSQQSCPREGQILVDISSCTNRQRNWDGSGEFSRETCFLPESAFFVYFLLWPRIMRMKTRRRMKMRPTRAITTRNHHSS